MSNQIAPIYLQLRFHPSEKSKLCNKDFNFLYYSQVYYRQDPETYIYYGKKYYSITYYMFYKENYAIGLNGIFPTNKNLGYHDKDIEHIRILYNFITLKPEYVYFSAHSQEGIWKKFEECELINNKLIIYISNGSHACRPYKGIYFRIFGFANDYCSDKGNFIVPYLLNDQNLYYLNISNKEVFSDGIKPFILPLINYKKEILKEKQKKYENDININFVALN